MTDLNSFDLEMYRSTCLTEVVGKKGGEENNSGLERGKKKHLYF